MAINNNSIVQDPTFVYSQFDQAGATDPNIPIVTSGFAVTTINAAAGPIITISGGSTGLTFSTGSSTISLTGTLAIANGGTGAITAAAARTSLAVPRLTVAAVAPAVTDDGAAGFPIGSLWVDSVLKNGFQSVDASTGAAIWKQTTA